MPSKFQTFKNIAQNHSDFERKVFSLLLRASDKVDWRQGGRDRAKDFFAYFSRSDKSFRVSIECKFYSRSISLSSISSTLDWAKVDRPDVVYFWVTPYITTDTKDFIKKYSDLYNIPVEYEEGEHIREYLNQLENGCLEFVEKIRKKILKTSKGTYTDYIASGLEYNALILKSDHFLVDRKQEREKLTCPNTPIYYIHGLSGTGKTQLSKHIAFHFYENGKPVFWHTFRESVDKKAQETNFLSSLASFFSTQVQNSVFDKFLNNFGNSNKEGLISALLKDVNDISPVFFLDDFHRSSSQLVLDILYHIAHNNLANLYLIAWFNTIPEYFSKSIDIVYVHLEGLDHKSLLEIVRCKNDWDVPPSFIDHLVSNLAGLPYYATLLQPETQIEQFSKGGNQENYIFSILESLSDKEIELLNALAISSIPIEIVSIQRERFVRPLNALRKKKLVEIISNHCIIHDTLRYFINKSSSTLTVSTRTYNLLIDAAKDNSQIYIDLIDRLISLNDTKRAKKLIDGHFWQMIDSGHELALLTFLNHQISSGEMSFDLVYKKALILERIGEYATASGLAQILMSIASSQQAENSDYIYFIARSKYFESSFNELSLYLEKQLACLDFENDREAQQCLLLLGRIFHIQGNLEAAAILYIFTLLSSSRSGYWSLAVKSLHRLSMLDASMGHYEESLLCFKVLLGLSVSEKRKSYILYRLAKCSLSLGKIEQSIEWNNQSIEIKSTCGHRRGLVFSWKLCAKIYLEKGEEKSAVRYAEKAIKLSQDLSLKKEEISCALVLAKIWQSFGYSREKIIALVEPYVQETIQMGLLHRAIQIQKLFKGVKKNNKQLNSWIKESQIRISPFVSARASNLSKENRLHIKEFIAGKQPIAPKFIRIFSV